MLRFESMLDDFRARDKYTREFGYVRVTPKLITVLKPLCIGRVVEVMCGTGHLAAALRAEGVTMQATDNMSWHSDRGWQTYTQVDKLDAVEAVRNADTVIMVWPYMDSGAYRTAKAMRAGSTLLYCGEGNGGCTANDEFFELMCCWKRVNVDALNEAHVTWCGLHDYWAGYRKP